MLDAGEFGGCLDLRIRVILQDMTYAIYNPVDNITLEGIINSILRLLARIGDYKNRQPFSAGQKIKVWQVLRLAMDLYVQYRLWLAPLQQYEYLII